MCFVCWHIPCREGSHGLDLSFVTHIFLMDTIFDESLEQQVWILHAFISIHFPKSWYGVTSIGHKQSISDGVAETCYCWSTHYDGYDWRTYLSVIFFPVCSSSIILLKPNLSGNVMEKIQLKKEMLLLLRRWMLMSETFRLKNTSRAKMSSRVTSILLGMFCRRIYVNI